MYIAASIVLAYNFPKKILIAVDKNSNKSVHLHLHNSEWEWLIDTLE